MARVTVYSDKAIHTIVSHIDGVVDSVSDEAKDIGRRAEARLARHRDLTNKTNHTVSVTHGAVDSFANLEGPAPLSVEFGHWYDNKDEENPVRKYVHGLYILTGAAGLAG